LLIRQSKRKTAAKVKFESVPKERGGGGGGDMTGWGSAGVYLGRPGHLNDTPGKTFVHRFVKVLPVVRPYKADTFSTACSDINAQSFL